MRHFESFFSSSKPIFLRYFFTKFECGCECEIVGARAMVRFAYQIGIAYFLLLSSALVIVQCSSSTTDLGADTITAGSIDSVYDDRPVTFGLKVSACYDVINEEEEDFFECRGSMDIHPYTPIFELKLKGFHNITQLSGPHQSWEEQCYNSVLYRRSITGTSKYYKDFVRQLFVCGIGGKGIMRLDQPEFGRVLYYRFEDPIELLTNDFDNARETLPQSAAQDIRCGVVADGVFDTAKNDDTYQCILAVTFREGDTLGEVVKGLQYRHQLTDETTIALARAIHGAHSAVPIPTDSNRWIDIRYRHASHWLKWLLQRVDISTSGAIAGPVVSKQSESRAVEQRRRYQTLGHPNAPITKFLDVIAEYDYSTETESATAESSEIPSLANQRAHGNVNSYSSVYEPSDISLVILSCRRLSMFQRTMDSLHKAIGNTTWGGLYDVFAEVIIIDDASSPKDRLVMMAEYGAYTLIFKPESQKGHARSLNLAVTLVNTKFALFMEDDFPVLNPEYLDVQSWYNLSHVQQARRQDSTGNSDTSAQNTCNTVKASPFLHFLHYSKTILKYDHTLAQVLLNDQGKRECGYYTGPGTGCTTADIHDSGWSRLLDVYDTFSHASIKIPYHLHEFGLYREYSARLHGFSYWPGFTLNPAVWNVRVIKDHMSLSIPDTSISSSKHTSTEMNVPSTRKIWFHESFTLFEMAFSIATWLKGYKVAYLEAVVCQNIGTAPGTSSYDLSQVKRGSEL